MTEHSTPLHPGGGFSTWTDRRSRLLDLFYETRTIALDLEKAFGAEGRSTRSDRLTQASQSLARESFRVMVFGDFSSGKSTLINALLGEDLLPTKENPTTAFTTVMRWDERPRAELYRELDGQAEPVTIEEFADSVELKVDHEQVPTQSPYSWGVVYWPFRLLESGVELIDSAGTNESAAREAVTLTFLPQVDAIVFVTTAKGAFKKHDQDHYLDMLKKLGHEDIFFVVNQFDLLRRDSDRADVRKRCRNIVRKYSSRVDRIFFASALDALDALGGTELDEVAFQNSGVPDLMDALTHFCLHDRARIKLLRPAEVLRREVLELRNRSAQRREMLSRSADELQLSLDQQLETRQSLELTVARIETALSTWVGETERYVANAVETHIRRLVPAVEDSWSADLPKKIKVHPLRRDRMERWAEGIQQIDDALDQRLQRELHLFGASEEGLVGFLRERQVMLESTLLPLLQDYQVGMEELRAALTGSRDAVRSAMVQDRLSAMNVQLVTRILATSSPGLSMGNMAGTGSMLLTTGGVAAGLVWAGLATAVIATPLALGLAAVGAPLVAKALTRRQLRNNAVKEYQQALTTTASEIAGQYAKEYGDALREQTEDLSQELSRSLVETIAEAEELIAGLRSNRTKSEEERRSLASWDESLNEIESIVSELVESVLQEMR